LAKLKKLRPLSSHFCEVLLQLLESNIKPESTKCILEILNCLVSEEDFLEQMNSIGYVIFERFLDKINSTDEKIIKELCSFLTRSSI
jgi:hypothetical protein